MKRKVIASPSEALIGGDAFVQVMDVKIRGNSDDLKLDVYAMNLHKENLIELEFEVYFFDSAEIKLNDNPYLIKSNGLRLESGKVESLGIYDIPSPYKSARKTLVKFLKGNFEDGNSMDLYYDEMERVIFTEISEGDINYIKKICGDDAFSLAKVGASYWRCICGYFNGLESSYCSNCNREKDEVIEKYSSMEKIKEIGELLTGETLEDEPIGESKIIDYKLLFKLSVIFIFLSIGLWILWKFEFL